MIVKEILQFIFLELQTAVVEKNRGRLSDLGTTVDVLYEASKKYQDTQINNLLERFDYVIFHYDEELSYTEANMKEIERLLEHLG